MTGQPWTQTHDQSGLTIPYVSGVTPADAWLAGNPQHSGDNRTVGGSNQGLPTVDYDLGATFALDRLVFFNYRFPDVGVLEMTVFTSDDPTFATAFNAGTFNPANNGTNSTTAPFAPSVLELADSDGRYLRLQVTQGQSAGAAGFSEIVVITPEPGTLVVAATGAMLLLRRRR